jgi:hypothetical protein
MYINKLQKSQRKSFTNYNTFKLEASTSQKAFPVVQKQKQ